MTDSETYECTLCNYSTNRLSNWTRHVNSKKHKSCVDKKIILEEKYKCETCNFKTNKLSSWTRHINTKRHKAKKIAEDQISSINKIADDIGLQKNTIVYIVMNVLTAGQLYGGIKRTVMENAKKYLT